MSEFSMKAMARTWQPQDARLYSVARTRVADLESMAAESEGAAWMRDHAADQQEHAAFKSAATRFALFRLLRLERKRRGY